MNKIPSSVPVFIQNLESQDSGKYSKAKLKVFYTGETPDHRLFTKDFSDKIMETLPSTPVVGYYSEEDDDFKGHNTVQYVYGHVPETAEISYEKDEESGNTFIVTDIILYTERKDNIGEVAKKIVGKQHSLELDPDTLKYKINRDKQGRFLNIEFTSAEFIGLSVLGDNQSPAFAGSGFFTANENFKDFASKCHQNFDKFLNFLNKSGGEIEVFNSINFFTKTAEFISKTMQEFQQDIYSALDKIAVYGYLCENTNDYAIISLWDNNGARYIKYAIENSDGKLSLKDPIEVKSKFLTDTEIQELETMKLEAANAACGGKKKESEAAEKKPIESKPTDDKPTDDKPTDDKPTDDKPTVNDPEPEDKPKKDDKDFQIHDNAESGAIIEGDISNAAKSITEQEKEKKENEMGNAAAGNSASALSDAERIELEGYRKAAKISIIDSYVNDLDEATLNIYRAKVDTYTQEDIEAKLAIEFVKFTKQKNVVDQTIRTVSSFYSIGKTQAEYNENDPAEVIKKYKNRGVN